MGQRGRWIVGTLTRRRAVTALPLAERERQLESPRSCQDIQCGLCCTKRFELGSVIFFHPVGMLTVLLLLLQLVLLGCLLDHRGEA